jgi:hypothetical protein
MRLVWATVARVESDEADVQKLLVDLDEGVEAPAISYPGLSGTCVAGDRVLLNTTALDLELGTGGYHFVVAREAGGEGVALDASSGGHVMKMRYSPLQVDVMSVEEQGSPHHETMRAAESLSGMPVACCGLHSHVPLVAAAIKKRDPNARVAYCMTDFGALPLALSDVVRSARSAGLLDATISCGHAFGGDLEAVNLHSGMLAARHVEKADAAIVAIGPGVVGTATPLGHGGIAQGEAINAVSSLGGEPVAVLRVSFADTRSRHHGLSHHTLTALTRVALASCTVPMPHLPDEYSDVLEAALDDAGVWERHRRVDTEAGLAAPPPMRGVEVATMGRGIAEDPAFFAAAFAAGEACVDIAHGG